MGEVETGKSLNYSRIRDVVIAMAIKNPAEAG